MQTNYGKIFKIGFGIIFTVVFIFVTEQLFFNQYRAGDKIKEIFNNLVSVDEDNGEVFRDLKIIYPDEPDNIEPSSLNPAMRQRLGNVYESLVKNDKDYKIQTSLAVNWGLIDDNTWEFRLRPNVKFHDGSMFDSSDVVASFKRAASNKDSQLIENLSSISEIQVMDDLNLRIKTYQPDPLLLNRLALVLIMPSEQAEQEVITSPIGTGPYKFKKWEKGDEMIFEKFDNYWGDTKPKFGTVEVFVRSKKTDRVKMFLNGDADLLAFVPYDAVSLIKEQGFSIATVPSLEVQFIIFNFNSKILSDFKNREAVSLAIDQDSLVSAVGGYARFLNQFISDGIYGFNNAIAPHEFDLYKAKELASQNGLAGKTLLLNLPKGLDILGNHIRTNLEKIGVYAVVSYLEGNDYVKSIQEGKADMYFLAFKSDIGDSSNFLDQIVYSNGSSNFGKYSNPEIDGLIYESSMEMDPVTRRNQLQKAMKLAVEDIMGVPLFEYQNVYSFVSDIEVIPRIDGLIYFDEINIIK